MVALLTASPLVSVLVPCHNYGRYVDECVSSMLSQSLAENEPIEIIVLDDGSTDDSWDQLQSLSRRTGILAIRNERNLGHVATLNRLIGQAAGDYIVVLDADDRAADRDALRYQVDALVANSEAGIACGDYLLVDESGHTIGHERVDAPQSLSATEAFGRLLLGNFIPHSGTLVRRRAYQTLGVHDPAFHYSHDWELWLRLTSAYAVSRIQRPLYAYRMHSRSLRRTGTLERTLPEFASVLERAREYSPLQPNVFEGLRRRGLANAQVLRATIYMSRGQFGAGIADLWASMRADLRSVVSWRVPRAFVSALITRVIGSRKERVLTAVRRRIASAHIGRRQGRAK